MGTDARRQVFHLPLVHHDVLKASDNSAHPPLYGKCRDWRAHTQTRVAIHKRSTPWTQASSSALPRAAVALSARIAAPALEAPRALSATAARRQSGQERNVQRVLGRACQRTMQEVGA